MPSNDDLNRGRTHFEHREWSDAFQFLTVADAAMPLGPEDLEFRGISAYMLGRDEEYVESLKRAHEAYLEQGDVARAVHCAAWIGHSYLFQRKKSQASGWFARGKRLLETLDEECAAHGYIQMPDWLSEMGRGNFEEGYAITKEVAEIGERIGDADLVWLARDDQARALIGLGRVEEGLRLVDEALVVATMGGLSPIITGIVYCNTISFCRAAYELRHVREWTRALSTWCEKQPEMVAHNGLCLVHRAEIKLMAGEWESALEEASRSAERFTRGALNQLAGGKAHYCQGEAHRLLGDFHAAEEAYRRASQNGFEPQPGLALMRLAQGAAAAASAAVRRVVAETTSDFRRAGILPAYVEIALQGDNLDRARAASAELDEIAGRHACEAIEAMASASRGAVALADSRPSEALAALRQSLSIWIELGALYEIGKVRALIASACLALEDEDTAALELDAAHKIFEELGAEPDRVRIERLQSGESSNGAHGLTSRQLEVLQLIAAGKTNREIADALFVSEHTVARHVQNIFARLDVSSRTAATAYAFENGLI